MALFFVLSFSTAIFLLSIQRGQCALITGEEVSRPYLAALVHGTYPFCGGTLISANLVLTAAQCSRDFRNKGVHVVLGAYKPTGRRSSPIERQYIRIAKKFVYPDYNQKTHEHDLMILKLEKKAMINQYVKPIQLPSTSDDVQPGTSCVVAGDTIFLKGSFDKRSEDPVTVIDRRICNEVHYGHSVVKDNMLCAVDKSEGNGVYPDSGDPLICGVEQMGIFSFGESRGYKLLPDVYTRLIQKHITWIKNSINHS